MGGCDGTTPQVVTAAVIDVSEVDWRDCDALGGVADEWH
jgi:hypothetical protein